MSRVGVDWRGAEIRPSARDTLKSTLERSGTLSAELGGPRETVPGPGSAPRPGKEKVVRTSGVPGTELGPRGSQATAPPLNCTPSL